MALEFCKGQQGLVFLRFEDVGLDVETYKAFVPFRFFFFFNKVVLRKEKIEERSSRFYICVFLYRGAIQFLKMFPLTSPRIWSRFHLLMKLGAKA